MTDLLLADLPVGAFVPTGIEKLGLSPIELRVLGKVSRRTNGWRGVMNETIEKVAIAARRGQNTIKAAYRRLIELGLIEKIGRGRHRATPISRRLSFYVSARLDDARLSDDAFAAFCYLVRQCAKKPRQISRKAIARFCDVSEGTVKRSLRELSDRNMIHITPVPGESSVIAVISVDYWDRKSVDFLSEFVGDRSSKLVDFAGSGVGSKPSGGRIKTEGGVGSGETHKGIDLEGIDLKEYPPYIPPRGEEESDFDFSEEASQPDEIIPTRSDPHSQPLSQHPEEGNQEMDLTSSSQRQVNFGLAPEIDQDLPDEQVFSPYALAKIEATRRRERMMSSGAPTRNTLDRDRKAALAKHLSDYGLDQQDFLHWLLGKMQTWNVQEGTVVDLRFARMVALKWATPPQRNETEDQKQDRADGNARLIQYLNDMSSERLAAERRKREYEEQQRRTEEFVAARSIVWTLKDLNDIRRYQGLEPLTELPVEEEPTTAIAPAPTTGSFSDFSLSDFGL